MERVRRISSKVVEFQKGGLKRLLGVTDLFAIGYGDLGSSIYYALGITAIFALGATPLALAMAGLVFICTALTYAEMTSSFHESGGSASFARHAFNDLISFIAGWGLLLDYIVTIAISAFAVGPYLAYFHPDFKVTGVQISFTIALILILFFLNLVGVRRSTRFSFFLVAFALVTQGVIIAIGATELLDIRFITEHMRINVPQVDWSPTWPEFWKGTAMAMVAYTGIESIAQLGAEAKKPAKSVPRSVIITMVVVVAMYLGISLVALSVVSPRLLGTQYLQDPIAGIVNHLPFGKMLLAPWVGLLAAILLLVAANAGLVGASRLSYNMGEYYQLPRFFSALHHRFRTPFGSLAFFALFAAFVVLASRGQMTFLADLYNFGAMMAFFFAHLSLIVMRIKKPDLKRPFRIPFNIHMGRYSIPITAIIGCLATASVWVLVVVTKPQGRYLGFGWMAFGLVMYILYRRKKRISATGQLSIERIKIGGFTPLIINKILIPIRGGMQIEAVQVACEFARLHGAQLTALYILEVPYSLPLDAKLSARMALGQAVLKKVEAVARTLNLTIDIQFVRSRSISTTVLDHLKEENCDLLILGSLRTIREPAHKGLGSEEEKILKAAPCRVWVCADGSGGNPLAHDAVLAPHQ